ncbi:MAG: glycosyltransferase family 4 protein [Vicinamibacterales bacterium]
MTRRAPLLITPGIGHADGVSRVAGLLAGAMAADHAPLEVWTLRSPGRTAPAPRPGLHVVDAGGSPLRLLASGTGEILAERPAIVVAHLHLLPVAMPALAAGRRVAVYLHGVEAWRRQPWWRLRLLKATPILLANSSWTARRFAAAHPELSARAVAVCPPAIADPAPPALRSPFVEREPIVVIVGRMWAEERYKGHDLLLDVWPEVRRRVPGARLVVIGDGDDRGRLEARARAEGLGESVRFTGLLTDAERDDEYRSARVFAMPSTGEGFGLVYLEAMRHGLPCVAGSGAPEEIVVDGVTGCIVRDGGREDLAGALAGLLADPDRCREMGDAGAARVASHFTVRGFEDCVRRALSVDASPC